MKNGVISYKKDMASGSGLGYCDLGSSIKKLADFPGETFRVLKEKEEKKFGEYRTRRLVLKAWDINKPSLPWVLLINKV
jgi:hypothetical protein